MADTQVLGTCVFGRAGSSPASRTMLKIKIATRALIASILLGGALFHAPVATAMGSGDKYSDLQTGVTYVVYKPSNTLKLKALNFEVRACRLHPGKEQYLLAGFGGMDQGIALVETAAAYNCTGIDHPKSLGTVYINGIKAKLGIYCSGAKCTASKFSKYGGEITFIAPATKLLKATYIRVGTQGGFTQTQLIAFATGLKPVA